MTVTLYDSIGRRLVERGSGGVFTPIGGWALDGLCRQVDPELFYPDEKEQGADAKTICNDCLVRTECLEWALNNNEQHGVWGGKSAWQRNKLRRKRRAA